MHDLLAPRGCVFVPRVREELNAVLYIFFKANIQQLYHFINFMKFILKLFLQMFM